MRLCSRESMRTSPEEIEKQLVTALETSGSLNGIADLLALASPAPVPDPVAKPPQLQHKAIYALYRVFTLLLTTKKLDALRSDPSPPVQAVRQWLLQKFEQFLSLLTEQLYNAELSISVSFFHVVSSVFLPSFLLKVRLSPGVVVLISPTLCRTLQQ